MTNLTVSLWRISMNNIKIFHCVNDVIIYKEFDASHNRKRHLTDTDSRKNIPSFLTNFFPCFNKSTHCHYCISVEVSISGAGKTNSVIINLGHLLICYGSLNLRENFSQNFSKAFKSPTWEIFYTNQIRSCFSSSPTLAKPDLCPFPWYVTSYVL